MNRKSLTAQVVSTTNRIKKLQEKLVNLGVEQTAIQSKIESENTLLASLTTTLAAAPPEVIYDRNAILARIDQLRQEDVPYSVIAEILNREGTLHPRSALTFSQATVYQMHVAKTGTRKKNNGSETPATEATAVSTPPAQPAETTADSLVTSLANETDTPPAENSAKA